MLEWYAVKSLPRGRVTHNRIVECMEHIKLKALQFIERFSEWKPCKNEDQN